MSEKEKAVEAEDPGYAIVRRGGVDCVLCAQIKVPGTTSEFAFVGGPLPSAHPRDLEEIRKRLDAFGVQIVSVTLSRLPDIVFRQIPKGRQPTVAKVDGLSAKGFFASASPWDKDEADEGEPTGPWG